MRRLLSGILGLAAWLAAGNARAQNDWQFPDPYFGAFQHRQAGTPQAERKYRAEIAPQQPRRLHEFRRPAENPPRRSRPFWHRWR